MSGFIFSRYTARGRSNEAVNRPVTSAKREFARAMRTTAAERELDGSQILILNGFCTHMWYKHFDALFSTKVRVGVR